MSEPSLVTEQSRPRSEGVRLRQPGLVAAVFACYLAIAIVLQWLSGAPSAQFGGYPDEPSHYVTGLMLHDYLRSAFPENPLAYAINYYVHLPMIGIGHWPPGFYVIEAAWMLLFGTGRESVLILMAILTALVSTTLYVITRPASGLTGVITGLVFLMIPAVRWSTNLVMADVCGVLIVLWASIAFARFLDTERSVYAIVFGLLASVALLTKPSAICLALVPPIAIVLSGKYRVLKHGALWISALIVLILCGPWYMSMRTLVLYGVSETGISKRLLPLLETMFRVVVSELGIVFFLFLAGAVVWRWWRPPLSNGVTTVLLALVPAALASVLFSGVGVEPRYLIPMMAPMVAVAIVTAAQIGNRIPLHGMAGGRGQAVSLVVLAILYIGMSLRVTIQPPHMDTGLRPMIARASQESRADGPTTILLVGGSATVDGTFISEFAKNSNTRGERQMIVRATKVLADMDWNGTEYKLRYSQPSEILNLLDRYSVDLLMLHSSPGEWAHCRVVREAVGNYPERLQLLAESQAPGSGGGRYQLFRFLPAPKNGERTELMEKLRNKFGRYANTIQR